MPRYPHEKQGNQYYHARETDAVPLEAEIGFPHAAQDDTLRGGAIVQREKFLFYRGVGTFAPLVSIRAMGEGKVRIKNDAGARVAALVLVTVEDRRIQFKVLGGLEAGKELEASLPESTARSSELAEVLVKELSAAGLFEKEARAMVKTWGEAWFGENGTRLLYLLPRSKADELLPMAIDPKPTEIVRVMMGRHDFLTPEQEAQAERRVERTRRAQAELDAVEKEMAHVGRFAAQARQLAEKRLENAVAK
jgi:hypothetical protein